MLHEPAAWQPLDDLVTHDVLGVAAIDLRMELHAKDRQRLMLEGFDRVAPRGGGSDEVGR